eukprot:scaffold69_cov248-Pinguiococcus_pyrenoidosus.AAC.17
MQKPSAVHSSFPRCELDGHKLTILGQRYECITLAKRHAPVAAHDETRRLKAVAPQTPANPLAGVVQDSLLKAAGGSGQLTLACWTPGSFPASGTPRQRSTVTASPPLQPPPKHLGRRSAEAPKPSYRRRSSPWEEGRPRSTAPQAHRFMAVWQLGTRIESLRVRMQSCRGTSGSTTFTPLSAAQISRERQLRR